MKYLTNKKSKSLIGTCALSGFIPLLLPMQIAYAQEGRAVGLEEIVVSAQRRQQDVQDVPIAINAFDASMVETRRIADMQSLSANIPGFSINTMSKSRFNPSLRGG